MPVAPRTSDAQSQISTARVMPKRWDADEDSKHDDPPGCEAAEADPGSHPGAPTKLPGYK